jgi:hypothetical protein
MKKNCISSIDFLGPILNFKIQGNKNFKSSFGGLSSILLFVIAVVAFLGFGKDLFEKKQPRVTFNRITDGEDIQLKYLTDGNFLFSIYDQYTDQQIPDFERRFEVYYDFLDFRGQGMIDTNFRNPFEKCSKEVTQNYTGYLNMDPSTYYCFPKNSKIEVEGVMSQGKSSLVRLQLDYCKNNTNPQKLKTNCIPKADTQKFLESKRIQMNYIIETALIKTNNYKDPSSKYIYSNSINTNALTWTRLNILFKKIIINTDLGFFLDDQQDLSIMALESVTSESIYSPDSDTVFSFLIGNSPWKEIYTRSYIKIQDVFAIMGGFLNASVIILKLIVDYIARPKLVNIFNKIYKFSNMDSMSHKATPIKTKSPLNMYRPSSRHGSNSNNRMLTIETPKRSLPTESAVLKNSRIITVQTDPTTEILKQIKNRSTLLN